MKMSLRILFGVSALALLLVSAPVLAAEVDVTGQNVQTGADSDNDNDFDVDSDIDKDVDNDGDVDNKAYADVTTGHNEQNKNTEGGDLNSGEVDASTDWESVVNAGAAMVGAEDASLDVDADFLNDTTGAYSDNDNDLDVDHDVDLDLDNLADIFNKLDLDANTGYNEQNKNTEGGSLTSGDVGVHAVIANWANNDSGFAGASGVSTTVDVTGENTTTGADSDNDNDFDVDNNLDVDIDNDADIDNKIDVWANTGHNEQNKNTLGGDLTTGSVAVTTDIENFANNGSDLSGASSAELNVTADFSNDTTGADSDNNNDLDVDQDVDVDVENDADVYNNLDVDANTGNNEQNSNTEGGSTETGDVTIEFNSVTEVNSN